MKFENTHISFKLWLSIHKSIFKQVINKVREKFVFRLKPRKFLGDSITVKECIEGKSCVPIESFPTSPQIVVSDYKIPTYRKYLTKLITYKS